LSIKPLVNHDRTVVTIVVLICGTFLLYYFGEQTSIVALVGSMWTLCLTFWFRLGGEGGE